MIGAVLHEAQAAAGVGMEGAGWEADAVVAHAEGEVVFLALEVDDDAGGVAVFAGVVHGFHGDVVELGGDFLLNGVFTEAAAHFAGE